MVNNGPSDAQGVVLTQSWPAAAIAAGAVAGCTSTVPLVCNIGVLAAGQTRVVRVQYTVLSAAPVGNFQSTAAVTSTTTDLAPGNNQQTDTTAVGRADLVADMGTGVYSPTTANAAVVLTVTVTDNGAVAARTVVGTVQGPGRPGRTALDSVSGACGAGSTPVACDLGTLLPGESKTYTVAATMGSSPTSPVTVTSTATTTVTESSLANNGDAADLVVGGSPGGDMAVTSAAVSPASVVAGGGVTGTYTTVVQNLHGSTAASGVVLQQTIPNGLTIVGVPMVTTGSLGVGGACSVTGQVVTCTFVGPVGPGPSATIETKFTVGAGVSAGVRTSTATVTSTSVDTVPANNGMTVDVTVDVEADVEVAVDDGITMVGAGDGLSHVYVITVTNNGPSNAAGVQVSATLPAGLVASGPISSTGGVCPGLPCTIGPMVPGAAGEVKIFVPYTTLATRRGRR